MDVGGAGELKAATVCVIRTAATRLAADSPLMIGLVPGMIIGDHKGSDHAIAPGESLGRDPAGGS